MKLLQSLLFAALIAAGSVHAADKPHNVRNVAPAVTTPVNINTADAAAIAAAMKGIGLSKAEAIVAYRQTHGSFKSLDQLAEVKGIGLKTIDKNRDVLTVGAGGKPSAPTGSDGK
jgi:competence protein ComEA